MHYITPYRDIAQSTLAALLVLATFPLSALAQGGKQRSPPAQPTVGPSQGTGPAWYAPGPLQVEIGGVAASWKPSKAFGEVHRISFRWRPATTNEVSAAWQLSSAPLPPDVGGDDAAVDKIKSNPLGIIGNARTNTPASGEWGDFSIDLTRYLPNSPPPTATSYFVRVVALGADGKPFKALTGNVTLIYKDPCYEKIAQMQNQVNQLYNEVNLLKQELGQWNAPPMCADGKTWTHPKVPGRSCEPFTCKPASFECYSFCSSKLDCPPGKTCKADGTCDDPPQDDPT